MKERVLVYIKTKYFNEFFEYATANFLGIRQSLTVDQPIFGLPIDSKCPFYRYVYIKRVNLLLYEL